MRTAYRATPGADHRAPPAFWRPFPGACVGLPADCWGGPASSSINSPCERSALPLAASITVFSEAWPASKSWAEELMAAKGAIACCQDWFRSCPANLSLASKNLPESQVRLKHAHGVSAQAVVVDGVDRVGHLHKLRDRGVVQVGKLGKHQVPVTELGELAGQQKHGFRSQALVWSAPRCPLRSA